MRLPRAALVGVALAAALATAPAVPATASGDPTPGGLGGRGLVTTDLDSPTTDLGQWSVTPAGDGGWDLAWTAPEPIPVTDAPPQVLLGGSVLGDALVQPDGRTVTLHVPGGTAPDPEALDVRLGTQLLDAPVADAVTAPALDGPSLARATTADPGRLGRHEVVTSDYTRPSVKLPGLTDPVEVVGHVEAPADATLRSPLVVLVPGRHVTCVDGKGGADLAWPCPPGWTAVPSHLGFHYLQRRLASQGFVTVSISTNGISAQDGTAPDGGAAARARLVQVHLGQWATWVAEGRRDADLSRVVLLGHSRGGEGAALAALETPLSAPYRVRGLVLLAPTDLARRATPYLPTVTLLPSCDGDVLDLQGQAYTDLAPGLAAGDTSLHSSVLMVGANHDFFNTEWTEDDSWATSGPCAAGDPQRLDADQQRHAARTYVAGAVRLLARNATAFLPMYDGSRVSVPSAGDAVVLSHLVGGGRALRRPGPDGTPTEATDGASVRLCRGAGPTSSEDTLACGRFADDPWLQLPHWPLAPVLAPTRRALEVAWTSAGAAAGLALRDPWDVSDVRALDLRTVVDPSRGPVRLDVRLTDATGRSATVTPIGGGTIDPLPSGGESPGRYWAQALRVPLTGARIDLRRLAKLELVARSDRGRVWVLDASTVGTSVPAVPARRVPLLDLGSVRVREGNGPRVARLPYRLSAPLTREATVRLAGLQGVGDAVERRTFTIAPGTTTGTLAWTVPGNRRDSRRLTSSRVSAYSLGEVVPRDATGRVTVVDDDPPPRVRVRVVRDRVSEGRALVWVVTWSPASDYAPFVKRRLLPVPGRRSLSSDDLPLGFPAFTEFALDDPHTQRWVVRVPTVRDGKREPRELVRVRLAIPQYGWRTTLRGVVRASR